MLNDSPPTLWILAASLQAVLGLVSWAEGAVEAPGTSQSTRRGSGGGRLPERRPSFYLLGQTTLRRCPAWRAAALSGRPVVVTVPGNKGSESSYIGKTVSDDLHLRPSSLLGHSMQKNCSRQRWPTDRSTKARRVEFTQKRHPICNNYMLTTSCCVPAIQILVPKPKQLPHAQPQYAPQLRQPAHGPSSYTTSLRFQHARRQSPYTTDAEGPRQAPCLASLVETPGRSS